jgi:hypothetical protein
MSWTVSKLNVLNVLNPPQKPVRMNNCHSEERFFSLKKKKVTPIIKQARIFEIKVAKGKPVW